MRCFIFFILFLWASVVIAQETFNKRVQLGCAQTIFTSVEATDSCYYITGIAKDSADCKIGNVFLKLDEQGEIQLQKYYSNPQGKIETWANCLRSDIDGNLVLAGTVFDSNQMAGIIIKYTPTGDTLWTRKYPDPTHLMGLSNRSDELVLAPDSSYIFAAQTNSVDTNSFIVMQLERDGRIRWYRNFGYNWNICARHSIVPLSDGFVMGYSNTDHNKRWINYTTLCQIKKMDYNGNVLWEWQNDSSVQYLGANDLIQTKDKGWVIGTAIGKEFLNSNPHTSTFAHDCYVFKLDSARNWLWGTPLRAYSYSQYAQVMKVIEQPDSSLLTFGITVDSFRLNGTLTVQYNAMVARLSPTGDSLWSHRHSYMEQAWAEHSIFDVEQTADSGYIIVGQAFLGGNGVFQQGWLLKLDKHGCLVPGCHLPDTTNSVVDLSTVSAMELKLYPNPTTAYLNVLYKNKRIGKELLFNILDQQGRILQSYPTRDKSNKTYVFPVGELGAGCYVLEVQQDGQLLGSKVFCVH